MKTLQNIAAAHAPIDADQLGYILGWLRHLTFLGFPGYAQRPIRSFDLFPSPICHQLPQLDLKQEDGHRSRPPMKRHRCKRKAKSECGSSGRRFISTTFAHFPPVALADPPSTGAVAAVACLTLPVSTEDSRKPSSDTPVPGESPSEDSDAGSPLRGRTQPPWAKAESSESEVSDVESSPQSAQAKIKTLKAKVRQSAYDTIRALLSNVDKKERFG